ncbi:MAG: hypothetical protein ABIZ49_04880 [Opitutaceae bacterium]
MRVSANRDDGQAVLGHARGTREIFADAPNRSDQVLGDFWVIAAQREFEFHLVRDDVALGAAVNRADGDDRGYTGFDLARDDGLKGEHDFRGEDDRILCVVRTRTMATVATHENVERVHVGIGRTARVADVAGGEAGPGVEREGVVGARETGIESVAQHRLGAGANFFGGLSDKDERAAPALAQASEQAGSTDEPGDVRIVRAGVHRGLILAGEIFHDGVRSVGQTGGLLDWECIHVGAQEHGGASAVFEYADDAGVADFFRYVEAERAQFLCDERGGVDLHERQLGVRMEVFVDRFE